MRSLAKWYNLVPVAYIWRIEANDTFNKIVSYFARLELEFSKLFAFAGTIFSAPKNTTFIDTIQSLLDTNTVAQNVTKNLTSWKPPSTFSRHDYDAFDRLLYWHGLLYIPHGPHSPEVLHVCHDFPMVGHLRMFKTIE